MSKVDLVQPQGFETGHRCTLVKRQHVLEDAPSDEARASRTIVELTRRYGGTAIVKVGMDNDFFDVLGLDEEGIAEIERISCLGVEG